MIHSISNKHLSLSDIEKIISEGYKLSLSKESKESIVKCRAYLDHQMQNQTSPIYGINTGFGSLCNIKIEHHQLAQLQHNLIVSHACGVGDEVPHEIIRIILLLKIQSLSYGYSGVQLATVERLIDFYNKDITPVVFQQGSLGASGDLAPLAHLSLPLLGLGEVYFRGEKRASEDILKLFKWEPITLQSKEGLSLINGTQFMCGYGVWAMIQAKRLIDQCDTIAAISLDAFDGCISPFDHDIHRIRPHIGQIETATHIRNILEGSELINQQKEHVQDPYSFRCIPQVHGASRETIQYAANVITVEMNSVTDNPTIFPDENKIISAGNFHGQPLALILDFLAIALAELGSISGQRTYQLIKGVRGLPKFLVANPGVNSGFMIPQYTAASIVSQSKQLCSPASVDSIESSQGQEDHVSMGANAATKLYRVVLNTERVLAIELFNAVQAIDFRRPLKSSPQLEDIIANYRTLVPFIVDDEMMYPHIETSIKFLQQKKI